MLISFEYSFRKWRLMLELSEDIARNLHKHLVAQVETNARIALALGLKQASRSEYPEAVRVHYTLAEYYLDRVDGVTGQPGDYFDA